jgi:enoyl-CoA hydratase
VAVDIVRYSRDGQVALIELDDGRVNALSHAMIAGINRALDRSEREQTGAVVIAGRRGCFSAGLDLGRVLAGSRSAVELLVPAVELAIRMISHPVPVVLAVTGHALGMGALLCCAADARIGADGDFKVGLNAVADGLALPDFAVELARERLSPRYLARAVTLAEVYAPATAVGIGYLDRVVPTDSVVEEALGWATSLVEKLDPTAYRETKQRLRRSSLERLRRSVDDGRAWLEASGEPSRRSTPNGA